MELSSVESPYIEIAEKDICKATESSLLLLQKAVHIIKLYAEQLVTESGDLFRCISSFVTDSIDSWNQEIKDEIMRLVLDSTVLILVVDKTD